MLTFILRRAALIVPTFIGVTLLAFALIHPIPGDPVENLSGERGMDPARRLRLLHEFGLDRYMPWLIGSRAASVALHRFVIPFVGVAESARLRLIREAFNHGRRARIEVRHARKRQPLLPTRTLVA